MDYIRKKWGVPIRDVWFEDSHEEKGVNLINIYYNHYMPLSEKCGIKLRQWQSYTLVSDISVPSREFSSKFKSKVRNEIRRAMKEGVTVDFLLSEKIIDSGVINDFNAAYIAMYKDKGQQIKRIDKRLYGIAKAGKLAIGVAYLPDGEVGAYHSYIMGDGIARLLHSVSVFREEPNKRKMIGWANRLLHFEDMCVLSDTGIKIYDWGGVSRDKKMINITRFKEEFGGKEKIIYYGVYAGFFGCR